MKTRKIVIVPLLSAMICISAPWSIPFGTVPITLATLAVYIASSVLDWSTGSLAVIVYILIGICGIPVFSGFQGGLQKLVGLTGGYIIGYIPCAIITGLIIDKSSLKNAIKFPLAMISGTLACYICGTSWFMFSSKTTLSHALLVTVIPFLPGDTVKIIIASSLSAHLRPILSKYLRH